MRYEIARSVVGTYLVIDAHRSFETVAAGMTQTQAQQWCEQLNLRNAWGI